MPAAHSIGRVRSGFVRSVLIRMAGLLLLTATWGAAPPAMAQGSPPYLNRNDEIPEPIAHADEGVRLFPYDWLFALEQSGAPHTPFMSPETVERYGFLSYPGSQLPIGFAVYEPRPWIEDEFACKSASGAPVPGLRQIGLNCSSCHTSEMRYTDKQGAHHVFRIDGGPSMQDNMAFMRDVLQVLRSTVSNPKTLPGFAAKVGGTPGHQDLSAKEIGRCVKAFLNEKDKRAYSGRYPSYRHVYPLEWGFGRFDALGRGGNTVFEKLDHDNIRPANAPVSIPPIWDTVFQYDRYQWNGAIYDYRARYIAQVIGTNAFVRLHAGGKPPFQTGFDYKELKQLAERYRHVPPPAWPARTFDGQPQTPTALMKEGKRLYKDLCAGCHVPSAKKDGERYKLKMIPLDEIGTDPTAAANFYYRTVKAPTLLQPPDARFSKTLSAARAGEYLTSRILDQIDPEAKGSNHWTARLAYIARPHAGVWATPPFLHNGSIPNLFLLLSPQEERDRQAGKFCLGDREFDPRHVGFVLKRPQPRCGKSEFLLDTTLLGNRNTGHEFRDDDRKGRRFTDDECEALSTHSRDGILGCSLAPSDRNGGRDLRMAVVEYLKSCDFELPWNDDVTQITPCPDVRPASLPSPSSNPLPSY